jgi:GxxExxY protein
MAAAASLEAINKITSRVIDAAIRIHRKLGPGLLESAYQACLCFELRSMGMSIETQRALPLVYEGVKLDCAYRADFVVEDLVIIEVKAQESFAPVHGRQMLTYLRVADLPAGLILNFGLPTMKEGITRVLNGFPT